MSGTWQAPHNGETLIALPVSLAILNEVKVMNSLVFDANKTLFPFLFSSFFPRWFWNGAEINTTFCLIPTETILPESPFRIGEKRSLLESSLF